MEESEWNIEGKVRLIETGFRGPEINKIGSRSGGSGWRWTATVSEGQCWSVATRLGSKGQANTGAKTLRQQHTHVTESNLLQLFCFFWSKKNRVRNVTSLGTVSANQNRVFYKSPFFFFLFSDGCCPRFVFFLYFVKICNTVNNVSLKKKNRNGKMHKCNVLTHKRKDCAFAKC